MPERCTFDYAVIRVVPHVERQEFINVGVIVSCQMRGFLGARIELDEDRLRALSPDVDLEVVRSHLDAIPRICAGGPRGGPVGALPHRERWHWLVAPRSTIVQTSPAHSGLCEDSPEAVLESLMDQMVRRRQLSGTKRD